MRTPMLTQKFVAAVSMMALVTVLALPVSAEAQADANREMVVATSRAQPLPLTSTATPAQAKTEAKTFGDKDQMVAWLSTTTQGSRADVAPVDYPLATESPQGQPHPNDGVTIHGSMGASIGTGGYRSAYVSALIPVGDSGTLGVSIGHTDYGNNVGYLGGYGQGYGQDYRHGFGRGGQLDSFGLSYSDGDRTGSAETPEGCAPGFRNGDQYLEPLWVTRMHGDRACAPRTRGY